MCCIHLLVIDKKRRLRIGDREGCSRLENRDRICNLSYRGTKAAETRYNFVPVSRKVIYSECRSVACLFHWILQEVNMIIPKAIELITKKDLEIFLLPR